MTKAKTCNGCRAWESEPTGASLHHYCGLKFNTNTEEIKGLPGAKRMIPAEECSKPTTIKQYIKLLRKA